MKSLKILFLIVLFSSVNLSVAFLYGEPGKHLTVNRNTGAAPRKENKTSAQDPEPRIIYFVETTVEEKPKPIQSTHFIWPSKPLTTTSPRKEYTTRTTSKSTSTNAPFRSTKQTIAGKLPVEKLYVSFS